MDIGVHITLSSEWEACRWKPISAPDEVPTLFEDDGYFWRNMEEVRRFVSAESAEREMRAQVEKVLQCGIRPSHIDSHMHAAFERIDLCGSFIKIAREYALSVVAPKGKWLDRFECCRNDIILDKVYQIAPPIVCEEWRPFYESVLRSLTPGVYELIVHPGFDGSELQGVTGATAAWGSRWRQSDFDVLTDPYLKGVIEECGISIVTWGDLRGRSSGT
jgi:predicted glycoside hydrolase/deacetylase ChbG (UPF0249 family)